VTRLYHPSHNPDDFVQPPVDWEARGCAAIKLNGCVGTIRNSIDGAAAHAHISPRDEWQGWICFTTPATPGILVPNAGSPLFGQALLQPNLIGLHEYAHIRVGPGHEHDRTWRYDFERLVHSHGLTSQLISVHNSRAGDRIRTVDYARPLKLAGRPATILRTYPTRAHLLIDGYSGNTVMWPYDLLERIHA
jgi:hypothetical protein